MRHLPILAACLLILIIGAELWATRSQPDDPGQDAAGAPRRAATLLLATPAALAEALLSRPLFTPGRLAPQAAIAAPPPPPPPPGPPPRLLGTLVTPTDKLALFSLGPGTKPVPARIGQHVGDWTVRAIEAADVHLDGPGGLQDLTPTPDPATSPGAPPDPRRPAMTARRSDFYAPITSRLR